MDFKHALSVGKALFKTLNDEWFVIIGVLGLTAAGISFLFPAESLYGKIFFSLGGIVTFSSIFSAMARYLSVHGVVKKELQNILYSEDHLKDPHNFEPLWEKLVSVAVSKYMPEMSRYYKKEHLRQYLPSEKELFLKDFTQEFRIDWHDKEQKVFKVEETFVQTILTASSDEHQIPYSFTACSPIHKSHNCKITKLMINDECMLSKVNSVTDQDERGVHRQKIVYQLSLKGGKEYRFQRHMTRYLSLNHEPFMLFQAKWSVLSPKVIINCGVTGISAFFAQTGTHKEFYPFHGSNNSPIMSMEYRDLLMKGQGWSIYFAAQ